MMTVFEADTNFTVCSDMSVTWMYSKTVVLLDVFVEPEVEGASSVIVTLVILYYMDKSEEGLIISV
jgi:hypothetical protein